MMWAVLAAILAWPLMAYAGYRLGVKARPDLLGVKVPPEATDGRFLVVARTSSGARARQMYERGLAGPGESLELWDGATCRGRKAISAVKEG
jgi:hypothetical protein